MSFRMAAMLALALSAIPAEFDGEIHKAVPVIAAEEETAAQEQKAEVPVTPTGTFYRVHGRTPNTEWQAALRNELRRYGIEWYMPYAVCQIWQESRWNQWSDNGHDRGITQQKRVHLGRASAIPGVCRNDERLPCGDREQYRVGIVLLLLRQRRVRGEICQRRLFTLALYGKV